MKKNIIIAATFAVFALLLPVSCSQMEQDTEIQSLATEGKVFTAKIDQELAKTVLTDEFKVNWSEDDTISINGAIYSATPLENPTEATFTPCKGGNIEAPFKAIYPSTLSTVDGYVFPSTQIFEAGKLNTPMYAESNSDYLSFKNICGVLRFVLKGSGNVKTISVTANEGVYGSFEMTDATTVNLTGDGKTVTLDCGQKGVQLDASTETVFYISLPPKTYSAGMRIVITDTDGKVFRKTTSKDVTIARSNSYTFNWDVEFALALTGKFSVGEGKQVRFSQGNLYCDNGLWSFYDNQYDWLTKLDLFSWGYGDWSANLGDGYVSGHETDGEAFNADEDWGSIIGDGSLWRTLSYEEWDYLINKREGAADKCRNGITVCGQYNCFIIAPDDFTSSIEDSYDASAWAAAEEAGLVCLPPTGYFDGNDRWNGNYGYYWSSSAAGPFTSHYFSFGPKEEPQPVMKAKGPKMAKSVAGRKQDVMLAADKESANVLSPDFTKPAEFASTRFADFKNVTPSSDLKFGNQDVRKSNVSTNAGQQGGQKILASKKVKADHNGTPKTAPSKAAAGNTPKTSGTDVNVTAVDWYYDDYYYDVYVYSETETYLFELNEDLVYGKAYTYADMYSDWVCTLDEKGYQKVWATDATLTVSKDEAGLVHIAAMMVLNGDKHIIAYDEKPFEPSGVQIKLAGTELSGKYYSYYDMYVYTAKVGANEIQLAFDATAEQATYTKDQLLADYCVYASPDYSTYVEFVKAASDFTVTNTETTKTLAGSLYASNGDEYILNLVYEKPDAKEININVKDATLTNQLTAGFWTISGQTADKNNSFSLYFKSKALQGTFTDVEQFDAYSTWVSDKSSGSNVYYENLSAVDLTSAVVGDSLVIEGTLNLADYNGNEAIVTVHISTPFTQTWGEWADFAPFDKNTGKYNFVGFGAYTQTGVQVLERKDNTGLKQYNLKKWGKGYYTANGMDLILNMNPDYTFTFISDVVNIGAEVFFADVATAYGNPAYASYNKYNPETGVFNFFSAVVFADDYSIYGAVQETFVMDKPITERDTVKVKTDMKITEEPAKGIITVSGETEETTYILEVVGNNPVGTFSLADGTLSQQYYYGIVAKDGSVRSDFAEGEVTIAETETGLKLDGLMIGEDEKAYVLDWTYTPITERDTVKVNLQSIVVEEDINSTTGRHRGWLYEGQSDNAFYTVQVLGSNQLGTFSYAAGTLGQNYYNIIALDGSSRQQFTEGEVTIVEDEEGVKLTGLLIGEDEKAYVLNWIQPAGRLQYDTDAPFEAEFGLDPGSISIKEGVISIYANNESQTIGLKLYTDPSATEIPEGTFVIADTEEVGTALKSVGLDDDYLLQECYAGNLSEYGGVSDCFFMVEGTVTLSYDEYGELKVVVDAKNSYGQDVKATIWPGIHRKNGLSVRLVADADK